MKLFTFIQNVWVTVWSSPIRRFILCGIPGSIAYAVLFFPKITEGLNQEELLLSVPARAISLFINFFMYKYLAFSNNRTSTIQVLWYVGLSVTLVAINTGGLMLWEHITHRSAFIAQAMLLYPQAKLSQRILRKLVFKRKMVIY